MQYYEGSHISTFSNLPNSYMYMHIKICGTMKVHIFLHFLQFA